MILYKRNNYNEPIYWSIEQIGKTVQISYGIVGRAGRIETSEPLEPDRDILSRTNQKRKEGYKLLEELHDNAPSVIPDVRLLIKYLNDYLPKFNTDANGSAKPMLAKTYEYKNGANRIAQFKINGLRCFISAIPQNDMFEPIKLVFTSREGIVWNHLSNTIGKVLLDVIPGIILKDMVNSHYILDGELYVPGLGVNEINHLVKDPSDSRHKDLQFWCYDVAIENMSQIKRLDYLYSNTTLTLGASSNSYVGFINSEDIKLYHLNNKHKFVILTTFNTSTEDDCMMYRDVFKEAGFEGVILRDPDAEYQFGRRNNTMIKYKPLYDGYFIVLDVIPEGAKRPDLPKFICQNDINDETFECTIRGTFDSQREYLRNKQNYIGKTLFVEYRERSGVKDAPFHAKAIKFKNE